MKARTLSKVLAMVLAVVMLIGVLPMNVLAASIDFDLTATEDDYYKLISKQDWELAPGINESEIVLNNEAGTQRQVAHVVEIDLNNPYTKVIPGYKEMIPTAGNYGTSSISTMASYAEENGYGNVVAATNTTLSWYNSAYYTQHPELVGEPLGYVILDGELLHTNSQGQGSGATTCIVINYNEREIDGIMTKRPEDMPRVTIRKTSDPITGWEEQVIPVSFDFLVKDTNGDGIGENVAGTKGAAAPVNHTSGFESRTFCGVKADGTLVVVVSDGRQAPYSTGFNAYEMADFMLKMGCVYAANCDGGGSTEFMSQRPGEDLKINCSLSDGGERPSTNSILVISTAPATGEFARATIDTEYDYYTPGSTVAFNALGSDAVGTEVAIPADVTWTIKEEGMGTIENGVFTSNGTAGTVTAQIWYNGEVVGEHSITLAIPDTLSFSQPVVTIPYGKKAMIPVKATIDGGLHEIGLSANDVTVTIDNDDLGTVDGLHFVGNAAAPENNLGTVTVTLNSNTAVTATVQLKLGEASVVMWDFEDGIGDWKAIVQREPGEPHRDFVADLSVVTAENGKVHDGNYALKLETNGLSSSAVHSQQYAYVRLGLPSQSITLENARSLGFWLYVPEDNVQCWVQGYYRYDTNGDGTYDTMAEVNMMDSENVYYNVDESGWHYLSMDLSSQQDILLGGAWNPVNGNSATGDFFITIIFHKAINNILWQTSGSINGPYTYYIDNITVDYSEVVDDREAPVFGSIMLENNGTKTEMKKRAVATTTDNILNVTAKVEECVTKEDAIGQMKPLYNYTGINADSAKAYIDGVEVPCTFANGQISIENVAVADGYHRVKFEICDNAGNKSVKIRVVEVKSGTDASTIQVVPADPSLDRLLGGSVYWMNMNATAIETIQSVTAVIDLNNVNHWELDHMELAYGFTSEHTIDDETNTATITITRTGTNTQSGAATLAKLPVRIISFDTDMNIPGYTAETFWKTYNFWPHDLKLDVDKGVITYVDGYESAVQNTFSNEEFQVDTEIYTDSQSIDVNYRNEKGTAHVHTSVALADKEPSCEYGYTGRTWCEVCDSVVEWGTTLPATGEHKYEVVNGKLTCVNGGELFNGVYTDGKTYVDGVVVEGWVNDNTSYYKDGKLLTGSHFMDGVMYTFDQNGIYLPDYKYDGFYEINDTVMYFVNNEYLTGMQRILGTNYSFDENGLGYDGEYNFGGYTCLFEDGVFIASGNVKLAGITGDDVHFVLSNDGVMTITGNGPMNDYTNIGNVPWYDYPYRSTIKTVFISKGVTTVGLRAFHNSPKLSTVIFEEGSQLKSISSYTFSLCPALVSIDLPEGLETILDSAFYNSTGLRNVYMPASLTKIGGAAFGGIVKNLTMNVLEGTTAYGYAKYQNINIVTRLGVLDSGSCGANLEWTLYTDNSLVISGTGAMTDYTYHRYGDTAAPWADYRNRVTKLVIGEGVETIGAFAFYNFDKVSSIEFADGSMLQSIGTGAFGYCGMTTVTIPASVRVIGEHAFYYSDKLVSFTVEEGNNLTTIGSYAFRNCTSLQTVYVPDSVKSIGSAILYACGNQATMQVANGRYAHTYAVNNGYAVELRDSISVVIYSGTCGDGLTWELYDDGHLVISGSGDMANYTYHKYGETAAPWALYRDLIKKITIGADVKSIGDFAFYNCTKLTSIEFAANGILQTIGEGAFGYCGMTDVTIPASVRTINSHAFYYCANLKTVAVEEGSKLFTLGSYVFRNCTSLQSVYIPDSIKSIGSAILYACGEQVVLNVAKDMYGYTYAVNNGYAYDLHEATPIILYGGVCGDSLTWDLYNNGDLVISGTGAMTNYTYHKYGETAAPWTLYRHLIKKVIIGSGVESIGEFAFYSCNVMTSVEFADDGVLKTIGTGAFGYCGMTTVTIPASVRAIGDHAFYYSDNLETFTVASGSQLAEVGNYAFRNCTSLKSVIIPAAAKIGSAIVYACGDQVVITRS